ncbi:hypothetical protein E2C01_098568 [Portunus trituberculatus]|uniref:Uncharacterized protein n=1 Tax=Portunus trituberculatus TaxID=210409 RepID=A0A5B7KCF1_PORTR|nr:hypothetical protein [Portunus trituberculatus]
MSVCSFPLGTLLLRDDNDIMTNGDCRRVHTWLRGKSHRGIIMARALDSVDLSSRVGWVGGIQPTQLLCPQCGSPGTWVRGGNQGW